MGTPLLHLILILLVVKSSKTLKDYGTDYSTPNNIQEDLQYMGRLKSEQYGNVGNNDKNDNHKPIFEKCSTYAPSVVEEGERGQHVIKVEATDQDPVESGGTLTYTIVAREHDRKYFVIANDTGVITTNTVFDRDEPSRMKEFWLTVQAADNGRPVLVDICTFKITVTDINDNAPNIDGRNDAWVAEDLKVSSEVVRVFAYDIDDGDNARLTYTMQDNTNDFNKYFRIDEKTGVIYLKESLNQKKGGVFSATVAVHDNPKNSKEQKQSTGEITIHVVGSEKKSPSFGNFPRDRTLKENYNDFDSDIITIGATSNIENPYLQFELVKGKTTQTNKDSTFILQQKTNTEAAIKLARNLDYETVTEYQLTVRVTNKDSLNAVVPIHIFVEDVNDEIPTFNELIYGSVLENERIGAEVMQVKALDLDGTSANNIVSYELGSETDKFAIDSNTGQVTTLVRFDREEESVYNILVIAKDNSLSAILKTKEPNSNHQSFRVNIEDRNDNPPKFEKQIYTADSIMENADIGKDVIVVLAKDKDTAALIVYEIIDGNNNGAFSIEPTTGRIKVAAPLDYEMIENYTLIVNASDGVYTDQAEVRIFITNFNDELPRFEPYNGNITIEEESIPEDCIVRLVAYDPDIKDRSAPQRIVYRVKNELDYLQVDGEGCVRVTKALDRDRPYGYAFHQVYILAYDDDDSPTAQSKEAELFLILSDINDNAPILNITEVVWYENEEPDNIVLLTAYDYDTDENGEPFTYEISGENSDISAMFRVDHNHLVAQVRFDREERKYYDVPIAITDNGVPKQTGVSILRVIIGDRNDNAAQDGQSEIFVYNYNFPDIEIGRVYVNDPDDWDLIDKKFLWASDKNTNFDLNNDNGMITMRGGTGSGVYTLEFEVNEEHEPLIAFHTVRATVIITVQEIPEEAVQRSGSARMNATSAANFIEKTYPGIGPESVFTSRKDQMQKVLAVSLNTSYENVHVFTVMDVVSNGNDSIGAGLVDVRFAAHGSPYYESERMNSRMTDVHTDLEQKLDIKFLAINVNECLLETACPLEQSCSNTLQVGESPAVVFTNRTSFVGVDARAIAQCSEVQPPFFCYNGGTPIESTHCICPEGFEGPQCQAVSVGFLGDGWALYPGLPAWTQLKIRVEIHSITDNGLVFYVGPYSASPPSIVKDFLSLELRDGYPVVLLDYGSGTAEIQSKSKRLVDGAFHSVSITLQAREIQLAVDDCTGSDCVVLRGPIPPNVLLNVNGPLQVGGLRHKEVTQLVLDGRYKPTTVGFNGCIKNLTYNQFTYNLGVPGDSLNAIPNCNYGMKDAQFGIDSNFLVAILVCIAILIILLLAVVVHRRKHDNWHEKDMDDIRDTIINYEDEGGGEGDTGFDLSVLQKVHGRDDDETPMIKNLYGVGKQPGSGAGDQEGPDISGFLGKQKDTCDRDANSLPYDDVRHYAYEGDGNSTGSLSSLASCTDDGDLKFKYLSNFGPRFRKLADMYGEDPSDEDSQDGGEESWC